MQTNLKRWMKALWRPLAGLAGLVVLVMWTGGMFEHKVAAGKEQYLPGFAVPAGAKTLTVATVASPSFVEVVGTAVPERKVNISARVPATLDQIGVSAGMTVTNGQVLAIQDAREIREQLTGAEARYKQAETEMKRTRQLFEKGATTDQARLAAETGVESARAQLEQIRVMLSYTTIGSPMDGVVTERRFEAGDLVAPGQVLMTIYDPASMRLEVPVPVRLLPRFTLNQAVSVGMDGVTSPVDGVVSEIVSEVDPLTRTRQVKIKLNPATPAILPGSYGRILVEGESHASVWVPASAVYRIGQQEFVQVVTGGRVIRRVVRTAILKDGQREVISGLDQGEVILAEAVKEG